MRMGVLEVVQRWQGREKSPQLDPLSLWGQGHWWASRALQKVMKGMAAESLNKTKAASLGIREKPKAVAEAPWRNSELPSWEAGRELEKLESCSIGDLMFELEWPEEPGSHQTWQSFPKRKLFSMWVMPLQELGTSAVCKEWQSRWMGLCLSPPHRYVNSEKNPSEKS